MTRDIRFTPKRVDESWKEQAAKEKGDHKDSPRSSHEDAKKMRVNDAVKTSKIFMNFV